MNQAPLGLTRRSILLVLQLDQLLGLQKMSQGNGKTSAVVGGTFLYLQLENDEFEARSQRKTKELCTNITFIYTEVSEPTILL